MKNEVIIGDCAEVLKSFPDESIDAIVTDPPYGYSFMGLQWDRALPSLEALKECNRVLKAGAFGFFMCAPRMDVLWRMGQRLEEAGFRVDFSFISHCYASGFPKSAAIDKLIDKRNGRNQETYKPFAEYLKQKRLEKSLSMSEIDRMLGTNTAYSWWEGRASGIQLPSKFYYLQLKELLNLDSRFDELIEREEAEREVIGKKQVGIKNGACNGSHSYGLTKEEVDITAPTTEQAKQFNGAFASFQPKPALECIIVAMKSLDKSCKTYVDQALQNGHGVTWLSDCRIPTEENLNGGAYAKEKHKVGNIYGKLDYQLSDYTQPDGRFPANLLCSDSVLDNGITYKSGDIKPEYNYKTSKTVNVYGERARPPERYKANSGSFSRYFDLDAWFDKKIQELPEHIQKTFPFLIVPKPSKSEKNRYIENKHPTVKPLKLMSYLITMGSREGDVILDPFAGSGTTLEACRLLNRSFIGIDKDPENEKYMIARGQLNVKKEVTLSDFTEVSL
jgi:site-specific DNA-methyltransferase (adenine-specific)